MGSSEIDLRKTRKMIGRLLFIYLLSVLAISPLSAQLIDGQVRDSMGESVAFASVVVTGCRDERVLAFTTTDQFGRYQLRLQSDCDSILLTARGLGYQPDAYHFTASTLPIRQDFVLLSGGLAIQEIVIRDKPPPVAGRRDTTEYDAAAFADSTEFSVEDLLKKIPGVRVGENGSITYNGKTVERVLLEGDDLFSNNYTLATRNLRADMVAKVQMIDRYQENQLMKGVQESDRLVMNLTIRADRKRRLSGSVTSGLGYGGETREKFHTNLFSLSRKDKLYLIANLNNTGEDAVSEVVWMSQNTAADPAGKLLQANLLSVQSPLRMPGLEDLGLPSAYTQANRSGLLYLGEVLPINPDFKVKISGWMGKERLRQSVAGSTAYLLPNRILEISETRSTELHSGVYHLQAAPEYFSKNKKQAVRGFLTLTGRPGDGRLYVDRSQAPDTSLQIVHRIKTDVSEALAAVEYTFKKSESMVFQMMSKSTWTAGHYLLQPSYAQYPLYFGLDPAFIQLHQTVDQRQGASLLLLRWLVRSKLIQWQLEAGKSWQWAQLSTELHLENDTHEVWTPNTGAYHNRLRLHAPAWFAQGSATGLFGPILVRPGLQIRYQPIRLTTNDHSASSLKPWSLQPQLDLRYAWSDRSTLSGFYKFQQEMPALNELYPAYLFTDYQTLERGTPDPAWLNGQQAMLVYRYNNVVQQSSWYTSTSWRQRNNDFGTQYHVNPFLIEQAAFRPVRSVSYALNGEGDRYFKNLSLRFALGAGFILRRESAKINSDELQNLATHNYSLHVGCGSAFDGWVNAILDSRLQYIVLQATEDASARSNDWFSTLQIIIKPTSHWQMKIFMHHSANRIGSAAYQNFYAADGLALFRLPKWHSELELTAFNLLGSRRFERVNANAFLQSRTSVTGIGRFFLVSWGMNF